MRILKNCLVLFLIFAITIGVGSFSNLSFADAGAEKAIKSAQSEHPELKSGYNLHLDKSPTISFKKKNSITDLSAVVSGMPCYCQLGGTYSFDCGRYSAGAVFCISRQAGICNLAGQAGY